MLLLQGESHGAGREHDSVHPMQFLSHDNPDDGLYEA
jgi:hypothetical protein